MNKIKILLISQSGGGVVTYLNLLMKYISKKKFELSLICTAEQTILINIANKYNVKVHVIKMTRNINFYYDILSILLIFIFVKKNKFDLIHAHSTKGGLFGSVISFLLNIPCLYTPHAYYYLSKSGFKKIITLYYEKLMRQFLSPVVPTSPSELKRCVDEVGYHRDQCKLFPNSIEIDQNISLIDNNHKEIIVLMVGRLTYQKNPEMFIRVSKIVCSKIPDVKFVLLGAGFGDHLSSKIHKLIDSLRLKGSVEILNWANKKETYEIIKKCTLLLMTSRYEGLPYAALEALSFCKPIVSTNVDGVRDIIIHGKNGYLVGLDDDKLMSKYTINIIKDHQKRHLLSEFSYNMVKENNNIEKNIKNIEKIYYSTYRNIKK